MSRDALLKGSVYRIISGASISWGELECELLNKPSIAEPLGFDPLKSPPSDGRFSLFLRAHPNGYFQSVRESLVHKLITEGVISGNDIALDFCTIEASVKENNFKTSIKDRYEKHHLPSGDKDARLGVRIHVPSPFKKEVHYFWGYRNHIINDLESELPIAEMTLQAHKDEKKVGLSMGKNLHRDFSLPVKVFAADANFDIEEMKAEAMIPRNPRNAQNTPYTMKRDEVYCQAGLPMSRKGKMSVKGINYLQYHCPLHWSKDFVGQYLFCPAGHLKFLQQKGCNVLIRMTPSIWEKVNYGTH